MDCLWLIQFTLYVVPYRIHWSLKITAFYRQSSWSMAPVRSVWRYPATRTRSSWRPATSPNPARCGPWRTSTLTDWPRSSRPSSRRPTMRSSSYNTRERLIWNYRTWSGVWHDSWSSSNFIWWSVFYTVRLENCLRWHVRQSSLVASWRSFIQLNFVVNVNP